MMDAMWGRVRQEDSPFARRTSKVREGSAPLWAQNAAEDCLQQNEAAPAGGTLIPGDRRTRQLC
jgi:hypothetical protein